MSKKELEQSWHARYEQWASKYSKDHLIVGWSEDGLKRRLALVLRMIEKAGLRPGSLILDLGSGAGTYTRALNKIGHCCLGLDYSTKMIEAATKKGGAAIYLVGEAYQLPFRESVFNCVICIGVLQSLERGDNLLREVYRILVPEGQLFLDCLNASFWVHRLRAWKERLRGQKKRMSYYRPDDLEQHGKALGFRGGGLHWLAFSAGFQGWVEGGGHLQNFLGEHLLAHAFLLHMTKGTGKDASLECAADSGR